MAKRIKGIKRVKPAPRRDPIWHYRHRQFLLAAKAAAEATAILIRAADEEKDFELYNFVDAAAAARILLNKARIEIDVSFDVPRELIRIRRVGEPE